MDKIAKVVLAIIASLIGAGFASGQEINTFFFKYKARGIYGLAICSILLMLIIFKTFKILQNQKIETYNDFVHSLVRKKNRKKYLNISFIINTIVNLFLIVTFFVMIAGFGAYFSQELGMSSYIGSSLFTIACLLTFMKSVNGVIKISSVLVPILIFFTVLIGIINFFQIDVTTAFHKNNSISNGWLLSSILYCSYNCILLIPMLVPLKKFIVSNKYNIIISIVSGAIIFLLAISIFCLLIRCDTNLNTQEMPALYIISTYFPSFRTIYAFIILTSIYTTAISIGVSLLENIAHNKKSHMLYASTLCIAGFFISGFGFSNLVALIYPIFGYLGLIQIFAILFYN